MKIIYTMYRHVIKFPQSRAINLRRCQESFHVVVKYRKCPCLMISTKKHLLPNNQQNQRHRHPSGGIQKRQHPGPEPG